MTKFELEEIFLGEAVPEGTAARMEHERKMIYLLSKLNVRLNRQREDFLEYLEELLIELR
jgi:hypothetical protein